MPGGYTTAGTVTGGALTGYVAFFDAACFATAAIDGGADSIANGGGNLRMYTDSSKATRLPLDVVQFVTGASPSVVVWARYPTGFDTATQVWVERDPVETVQPAVTNTYGRNSVWSEAQLVVLMEDENGTDRSGTSGDMTVTGTSWSTLSSPFGSSLYFDSSHEMSNSDTTLRDILTTNDTTASIVSRRSAYALDKAACNWEGTDYLLVYPYDTHNGNGERIYWRYHSGSYFLNANDDPGLQDTWLWTDFTTRASNDHELYRNGASLATSTNSGTQTGPFSSFWIGSRNGTGQWFDGYIASVIIWKSARSDSWISTQKNNQSTSGWFTPGSWGSGTDVLINGTPDALLLSGQSSQVDLGTTINGAPASLTLSGQSSQVDLGIGINATPASLTINGLSAQVDQGSGINGVIAALALAGQSGQIDLGNTLNGSIASLSLSGITGDVLLGTDVLINGTPASLMLSGIGSQVNLGSGINGTPATLTLSGITGNVIITNDVIINASPANITLNGITASVTQQVVIDGQIATINLTGNVSEVTQSISVNGAPGSLALAEITADVVQNMTLSATPGTLTITGISGSITAGTTVTILQAESIDMKLFIDPIDMKLFINPIDMKL